jgi:purine-binding chemotaxis protein CheW
MVGPGRSRQGGTDIEILSFEMGETEFGISMIQLCEVVYLVEILSVENDGSAFQGVINYRGTVIPVIDVRRALRLPARTHSLESHIIIAQVDNEKAGLIVDRVRDVLQVSSHDIEEAGPRLPYKGMISGVAKLEDRLLLLIDLKRFLEQVSQPGGVTPPVHVPALAASERKEEEEACTDLERLGVLRHRARELSRPIQDTTSKGANTHEYLRFALREGSYAIATRYTKEVVSVPPITPIPCTPDYIQGAINIRGVIMPVVDLALLLKLEPEPGDGARERKIIVIEHEQAHIGLHVDQVHGLYSMRPDDLSPPLVSLDEEAARLLDGEFDHDGVPCCVVRIPAVFSLLEEQ